MNASNAVFNYPPQLSSIDSAFHTLDWFICASLELDPGHHVTPSVREAALVQAREYLRRYYLGIKDGMSTHDAMLFAERREPHHSLHACGTAEVDGDAERAREA